MTRQEPHTCDVCGELFYVPSEPLHTLEIDRGLPDELIWDLCGVCRDSLDTWILKRREQAKERP